MREQNAWAQKSRGRDAHREFYAGYITSAQWFRKREQWAACEAARLSPAPIQCRGNCGTVWSLRSGDLHHITYDRLGEEAHEDLWPMCRSCHTMIHDLMESSRSWRRLPKRQANLQAIAFLSNRTNHAPARTLTDYL